MHAGFIGIQRFVTHKKSRCKLIGIRIIFPTTPYHKPLSSILLSIEPASINKNIIYETLTVNYNFDDNAEYYLVMSKHDETREANLKKPIL